MFESSSNAAALALSLVVVAGCQTTGPAKLNARVPTPVVATSVPTLFVCIASNVMDLERSAMPWAEASISVFSQLTYDSSHQFDIQSIDEGACHTPGPGCDHWRKCQRVAADACYGERGSVYCNLTALARIAVTEALVISVGITTRDITPGAKEDFTLPINIFEARDLLEAMERHKPQANWDQIEKHIGLKINMGIMAIVLPELITPPKEAFSGEKSPTMFLAKLLEGRALMDVYGFVIGHELAHAWGFCPIVAPSAVETSGMLDALVGMQTNGSLCPMRIEPSELAADRCALRAIAALEANLTKDDPPMKDPKNVRGNARVLAAQAVQWITSVGLGGQSKQSVTVGTRGEATVTLKPRSGYMYTALRLALFATLLRDQEDISFVGACDDVGDGIVKTLAMGARPCETEDTWVQRWLVAGQALGRYFPPNSAMRNREKATEAAKQKDPIAAMTRCF
jgi:hypothetical protein